MSAADVLREYPDLYADWTDLQTQAQANQNETAPVFNPDGTVGGQGVTLTPKDFGPDGQYIPPEDRGLAPLGGATDASLVAPFLGTMPQAAPPTMPAPVAPMPTGSQFNPSHLPPISPPAILPSPTPQPGAIPPPVSGIAPTPPPVASVLPHNRVASRYDYSRFMPDYRPIQPPVPVAPAFAALQSMPIFGSAFQTLPTRAPPRPYNY